MAFAGAGLATKQGLSNISSPFFSLSKNIKTLAANWYVDIVGLANESSPFRWFTSRVFLRQKDIQHKQTKHNLSAHIELKVFYDRVAGVKRCESIGVHLCR